MGEVKIHTVNSDLAVTSREPMSVESASIKDRVLASGHEFIKTIASKLESTVNKISTFLRYEPTGQSITSMASAIVFSRNSLENIDKNENLSQASRTWAKFKSGVVTKFVHIPIATVHEIAAGILKCINRASSKLAQAAELGKITVLTNITKIKNNPENSSIKKTALIALAYFKEALKLMARSTLVLVASSLELGSAALMNTAKGVSLILLNTHNAAGDISKPMQRRANALSQKALQFFDKIQKRMEGLSDDLSISQRTIDSAKQTNAVARAQADLDQAEKELRSLEDVQHELENVINKKANGFYNNDNSQNALRAKNDIRKMTNKAIEAERNFYKAHEKLFNAKFSDQIAIASNPKLSKEERVKEMKRIDVLKEKELKKIRDESHVFIMGVKNLKDEYLGRMQET